MGGHLECLLSSLGGWVVEIASDTPGDFESLCWGLSIFIYKTGGAGNHLAPPIMWIWNDIPKDRCEPGWIKSLEVEGCGVTVMV